MNSRLAFQAAMRAGSDEAILLNESGCVSEGTGENVFVVKDLALVTPPPSADLLPSITRGSVLRIAENLGHRVRDVNERAVRRGSTGPVTQSLQKGFFAAVRGKDPRYPGWPTLMEDGVSAAVGNVRQLTESMSASVK